MKACRSSFPIVCLISLALLVLFVSRNYEFIVTTSNAEMPSNTNSDLSDSDVNGQASSKCLAKALSDMKDCILGILNSSKESAWDNLHPAIEDCRRKSLQDPLDVLPAGTDKTLIKHRKTGSQDCVLVTIGIGNEVLFEQNIYEQYNKHCRFYGADPIEEMAAPYRKFGKTFVTAVDANYGYRKLVLLSTDGKYKWRNASTVPFHDFIDNQVNESVIDFIALDSEGSEYRILPTITSDSPKTEICQMALELHGPLSEFNLTKTEFAKLVIDFLENSSFVPFSAFPPGTHHRFSVFNMKSQICLERYSVSCKT